MVDSSWRTIGIMSPSSSPARVPSFRLPLQDTTAKVNNYQPTTTSRRTTSDASSLNRLPHHESQKPINKPQTHRNVEVRHVQAENKHLSAIVGQDIKDLNRVSQISTTSTNADGKSRRKTHVGPWHLGRTLGKGATGRVRFARHKLTSQPAAIKIVSKKAAMTMQSRSIAAMDEVLANTPAKQDGQRTIPSGIEREVIIMKLIEHPNIISLYDVWENRGEYYLIMEYVEGGELYGHIDKHKRLPEFEAVRIFRQMISGLSYCHRLNIYHRDLKPENILLDKNLNVKLVDFGMAALQPRGKWLKTSCGSPHYAPPEIAWGHKYQGAPADCWSAGVVLYAMLVGRLPFGTGQEGEDPKDVLKDVVRGEVCIPDDISDEAEDLILKMLQLNPEDRIALDEIWEHPLLVKYAHLAKHPKYAPIWIGSPPPQLTEQDCGKQIKSRNEIDPELLRNLCTLWQYADEETLIAILLSTKACYEKVFYNKLLKYRDEQLENYQGPIMEFSTSDYHHITRPVMRRSSTRASLQGKGQVRTRSHFSIIVNEQVRRPSYASGRQSSVAETEGSYDPYRSSRPQMANTQADHARITVLHGQADPMPGRRAASGTPSFRNPSLGRVESGAVYSIHSSPPPLPTTVDGRLHILRRQQIARNYSRSSIASSHRSIGTGDRRGVRTSMSYKRGVIFNHGSKRSSSGPDPQPRESQRQDSANLHRRYISDEQSRSTSSQLSPIEDSYTPEPTFSPKVRSRKEKSTRNLAEETVARKSKRASIYWKEEARKVSSELENLCDEAFNPPYAPAVPLNTSISEGDYRGRRHESPAYSVANESQFASSSIIQPSSLRASSEADKYRQRPLPRPPLRDQIETKANDELTRARELLLKRAQDLSPGALDEVIAQIDRLMQQRNLGISDQEYQKRIASAPVSRTVDARLLSPVKEDDEWSRTPMKTPMKSSKGYRASSDPNPVSAIDYSGWKSVTANKDRSTIRLVDFENVPRPAPLVIRKQSRESVKADDKTRSRENLLGGYTNSDNQENSRNDPTYRPQTRAGYNKDRTSAGSSALDPIIEDYNKENEDPQALTRASGDSRKRGWFRKRWSDRSDPRSLDSDGPPTPPLKDGFSDPKRGSGTPSEDSHLGESKQEKSGKGIFSKLFRPRDNKGSKSVSELALTGRDLLDDCSSTSDNPHSRHPSTAALMSGALPNASTTTIATDHLAPPKHARFTDLPIPRPIRPQPQSWLARFLHIKPASKVFALRISALRARREIATLLKSWRQHGLRDIVVDRVTQRVWCKVGEGNALKLKEVEVACEMFPIYVRGRRANLCVVRWVQERGAKSSFLEVVRRVEGVFRERGHFVLERGRAREMRGCLVGA